MATCCAIPSRKGSGCEFRTIPVTVKLTRKHRILTVYVHFSNSCLRQQNFASAEATRAFRSPWIFGRILFIADKKASHSDGMQPLPSGGKALLRMKPSRETCCTDAYHISSGNRKFMQSRSAQPSVCLRALFSCGGGVFCCLFAVRL